MSTLSYVGAIPLNPKSWGHNQPISMTNDIFGFMICGVDVFD
jgi:hypothetical protein